MTKECPKCHEKNTWKASKLGMYASNYFCKTCAIYFSGKKSNLKKIEEVKKI